MLSPLPRLRRAVTRARPMLRRAAIRFAGLPHSSGTVDSPLPEVAGDVSSLWRRNSVPWFRERIVDPATPCVVTMTTHGTRIKDAWVAIEAIGRGSVLPGRVLLWLEGEPRRLPWRLRRLVARGLEVCFTAPGLGVHTKYYPYLTTSDLDVPLVLCDDDILYPPDWLERLLAAHRATPGDVVAYRAHAIGLRPDDSFEPYTTWEPCRTTVPSFAHFATSVSGQVLPPTLQRAIREEGDRFRQVCPTADDVWLHWCGVRHGFRTRQVVGEARHWWFVPGSQTSGLNAVNVWESGNDRQLAALHDADSRARIRADL